MARLLPLALAAAALLAFAATGSMAANVNVKFSVEVAFSSSDPLYIVGGYFGDAGSDSKYQLKPSASNTKVYELTLALPSGGLYEFKFAKGACTGTTCMELMNPSEGCTDEKLGWRYMTVGTEDMAYGPVCYGSCTARCGVALPKKDTQVTFQVLVDPSKISKDGMFVAGGKHFMPHGDDKFKLTKTGMVGPLALMSRTIAVPLGTLQTYVFINGKCPNNWGCKEQLASLGCAAAWNWNDRVLYAPAGSNALKITPVVFGHCGPEVVASIPVTFYVDMSAQDQGYRTHGGKVDDYEAAGVFLAGGGTFGDPGDNPMTDTDGDGIYEITMDIVQGTAHNYIFTIGTNGDWSGKEALNGHNCAVGTFDDRDVSIGSGPSQTVGPFCFAQCCRCDHAYSDAKYTKKPSTPNQGGDFETAVDTSSAVDVTFMVDMALEAVSAKGVFLAGSGTVFGAPGTNQAMKLKPFAGSIYQVTTKLTAGKKYHYTVTNGVGSASAPLETQEDLLNQECGDATFNAQRIIKVPDSPGGTFVSPQICFGGCKACKEYTKKVKVTFLVDMAGANSVEGSGVYLAGGGTFGVPGDNKMKVLRGKLHTITMTLPAYSHHAFAFVNGMTSDWSGKEDISGLPCAAGQYNDREFTAGDGDMTVGPFCYGKCCACGGAKTVKIKFLVNFINTEVAASGAFIAGGSLGLPGQLDKQLLDDGTGLDAVALDGIYTGMIEVSANAHQVYTITNGDCQDWLCKEDIVGKPCAFGAWADRYIGNTGDKDFTVEQCFGHCASCARADTGTSKVDLSFQVDMGKETVNADGVYLSGGVFGPSGSSKLFKMAKTSGSIYAVTLSGWPVNLKP